MLELKLSDTFFIELDENRNHTLKEKKVYEKGKNIGKTYDLVLGYFPNMQSAVWRYLTYVVLEEHEIKTLKDYIERLEKLKAETLEQFKKEK